MINKLYYRCIRLWQRSKHWRFFVRFSLLSTVSLLVFILINLLVDFAYEPKSQIDPKEMLVKMGYSWNKECFYEALKLDDEIAVRYFLRGGMPPNIEDNSPIRLLIYLNHNDFDKYLNLFVEFGYDVDSPVKILDYMKYGFASYEWKLPLVLALEAGNYKAVKSLINKGANSDLAKKRIDKFKDKIILDKFVNQAGK